MMYMLTAAVFIWTLCVQLKLTRYACCAVSMTTVMHCLTLQDQATALMRAAVEGNVGIVKLLIQQGANVNLTNKVTGPCAWCV